MHNIDFQPFPYGAAQYHSRRLTNRTNPPLSHGAEYPQLSATHAGFGDAKAGQKHHPSFSDVEVVEARHILLLLVWLTHHLVADLHKIHHAWTCMHTWNCSAYCGTKRGADQGTGRRSGRDNFMSGDPNASSGDLKADTWRNKLPTARRHTSS